MVPRQDVARDRSAYQSSPAAATPPAVTASRGAQGPGSPLVRRARTASWDCQLSTERSDCPDRNDPRLWNDPADSSDIADPIDPTEANDPTDPKDSTDPADPIDSTESVDHSDSSELREPIDGMAPIMPDPASPPGPDSAARRRNTMTALT